MERETHVPTQDVHFADNKAASADSGTGMGGALYVSPDCSCGFSCNNVSANVTAFSMFGNSAGEVRWPDTLRPAHIMALNRHTSSRVRRCWNPCPCGATMLPFNSTR